MLIGTNGSGKSTILKQINSLFNDGGWVAISHNDSIRDKYACFLYDNKYEERHTKQLWLESGSVDKLAATFTNSEGQDMYDFLYYKLVTIGRFIRVAKQKSELKGAVLLFDGLDSGLSLDMLDKLKSELLDFIVNTELKSDFEIYIICSANSFELCEGYNCLDIISNKKLKFSKYDLFKDYMLEKVNVANDSKYQ